MLTKISGKVFHALKVPQSKYHLIWTSRSKKNEFQRSLFRGAPFQINTFISYICICGGWIFWLCLFFQFLSICPFQTRNVYNMWFPVKKKTCQSWSRNTILGHPTIFMQKKATEPNVRDLVPTLDLPFIGSYLEISRRCEKRAALRNHEYYKERHGNQTHRGCPRPQGRGVWGGDPQKLLDIYIDWTILVCFSRVREAKIPRKVLRVSLFDVWKMWWAKIFPALFHSEWKLLRISSLMLRNVQPLRITFRQNSCSVPWRSLQIWNSYRSL